MGAAAAIFAFSAVMQGVSAYSQSKAQKSEGSYESSILESNARMADAQSEDAIFRGDQEAARQRENVKKLIGAQRAAMGAQGIEVNDGSALDVQADTAGQGAIDELTIKNNAWREAWGYRVQANDLRTQGQFAKLSSENKARNTILTAGANIISDGASAYTKAKSGATPKASSKGSSTIRTSSGTGYRKDTNNRYI